MRRIPIPIRNEKKEETDFSSLLQFSLRGGGRKIYQVS
jgi:hypothetical protein